MICLSAVWLAVGALVGGGAAAGGMESDAPERPYCEHCAGLVASSCAELYALNLYPAHGQVFDTTHGRHNRTYVFRFSLFPAYAGAAGCNFTVTAFFRKIFRQEQCKVATGSSVATTDVFECSVAAYYTNAVQYGAMTWYVAAPNGTDVSWRFFNRQFQGVSETCHRKWPDAVAGVSVSDAEFPVVQWDTYSTAKNVGVSCSVPNISSFLVWASPVTEGSDDRAYALVANLSVSENKTSVASSVSFGSGDYALYVELSDGFMASGFSDEVLFSRSSGRGSFGGSLADPYGVAIDDNVFVPVLSWKWDGLGDVKFYVFYTVGDVARPALHAVTAQTSFAINITAFPSNTYTFYVSAANGTAASHRVKIGEWESCGRRQPSYAMWVHPGQSRMLMDNATHSFFPVNEWHDTCDFTKTVEDSARMYTVSYVENSTKVFNVSFTADKIGEYYNESTGQLQYKPDIPDGNYKWTLYTTNAQGFTRASPKNATLYVCTPAEPAMPIIVYPPNNSVVTGHKLNITWNLTSFGKSCQTSSIFVDVVYGFEPDNLNTSVRVSGMSYYVFSTGDVKNEYYNRNVTLYARLEASNTRFTKVTEMITFTTMSDDCRSVSCVFGTCCDQTLVCICPPDRTGDACSASIYPVEPTKEKVTFTDAIMIISIIVSVIGVLALVGWELKVLFQRMWFRFRYGYYPQEDDDLDPLARHIPVDILYLDVSTPASRHVTILQQRNFL